MRNVYFCRSIIFLEILNKNKKSWKIRKYLKALQTEQFFKAETLNFKRKREVMKTFLFFKIFYVQAF